MTHIYTDGAVKLAAAKGAVERIMAACHMSEADSAKVKQYVDKLAAKGSRILGVASALYTGDEMPARQDNFDWQFEGLISLYDPPKENIKNAFEQFYTAGIGIRLLTGDHGGTAVHIANQVGLKNNGRYITGDEVMQLPEASLQQVVNTTAIFARMFPEAKRRVVRALKANNETVAMTGDGVNDGPALKSADIGIAMGRKGTEIARQAASLILTDDNIEKMVEAIRQGRKIFHNLKKAVRYIISIHIPIILTASIPIVLGWQYPNIFTPIHVIFLELIMGPTCSIFFEREPVEADIMQVPPRQKTVSLFSGSELSVSIIQGVIIALAMLILYYVYMSQNYLLPYVRTLVFTTMVLSNILLTFVNRSFTETIFKTIRYKNSFALPVLLSSIAFLAIVLLVPAAQSLFRFTTIGFTDFLVCVATALAGVLWFELYKFIKTFKKHALYQKRNLVGEINV
jgi:Ca2+-transporting ATPase